MVDFLVNCKGLLEKAIDGNLNPGELARWEEHLRSCRSCAQQWETFQQSLVALQQAPVPQLPADFDARLLQKIRGRDIAFLLPARTRWFLGTYWIAAGLTAIYISAKLSWPETMPTVAWLVLAFIGIGMILPVMACIRSQRSLLDFALKSVGLRQSMDR
jgi:anti-sigma factor RsiW